MRRGNRTASHELALAVGLLAVVASACSGPSAPPDAALPTMLPTRLSETGLYDDLVTKQVAARNVGFTPKYVLWSDAAVKSRWIHLPAGAVIDTENMDRWTFPVGTQLFKEFAKDGKRLETRLIWRVADTGDRETDTLFGAYVWNDDETEAVFAPLGATNVRGTAHDVPSADACWRCHIGEPGRSLGFSALQLEELADWPLSAPPGTNYAAPDPALGYLHANCGHCHNPQGGAWSDSSMVLRLDVDETTAAATQVVGTTVDVPLEQWIGRGFTYRIVAGDPANSAIIHRMMSRTLNEQMPPIATEQVDDAGVTLLQNWILSL